MAGVWVAQLERFGYTLVVAERTKQKALDAMAKEYTKTYFKFNHEDRDAHNYPWYVESETIEEMVEKDETFRDGFAEAIEEVYCRKMEYGKVEWC